MNLTLIIAFIIVCVIVRKILLQPGRDLKEWQVWEEYLRIKAERSDASMVKVTAIRQQANTGVKGFIHFLDDNTRSAAWFQNQWPGVGSQLLVTGSYGTGRHHDEQVFYVNFYYHIPVYAQAGWQRHNKRLEKKQNQNTEK